MARACWIRGIGGIQRNQDRGTSLDAMPRPIPTRQPSPIESCSTNRYSVMTVTPLRPLRAQALPGL